MSWVAPFSLNLTKVEPDIVYSVEIYNITCGERELIFTSDVYEPRIALESITSGDYIYEYSVTARNNVDGAIQGIPVKGMCFVCVLGHFLVFIHVDCFVVCREFYSLQFKQFVNCSLW